MTHRSRICAVLVDTGAATHETVARFWGAALGRKLEYSPAERYANLYGAEDPGGHRVAPVQSTHWPEGAAEWP